MYFFFAYLWAKYAILVLSKHCDNVVNAHVIFFNSNRNSDVNLSTHAIHWPNEMVKKALQQNGVGISLIFRRRDWYWCHRFHLSLEVSLRILLQNFAQKKKTFKSKTHSIVILILNIKKLFRTTCLLKKSEIKPKKENVRNLVKLYKNVFFSFGFSFSFFSF